MTMKKNINNYLRITTMVMSITLSASAMAREEHKDGKTSNLLCVSLDGAFKEDAIAIMRVENNGQAHGIICLLDLEAKDAIENCNFVTGQALSESNIIPKFLDISVNGTSHSKSPRHLVQTDAAFTFTQDEPIGEGEVANYHDAAPWVVERAVGQALQYQCGISVADLSGEITHTIGVREVTSPTVTLRELSITTAVLASLQSSVK